ncbi:O-linked N-acetylglucosamine transferase, SPINDLY family protein [Microcoleus sp. bin38.metabat.b11b12b14.051]|uniref:O-linked N-acetylglucosamine transferase, SPINDLY family protein n=1 Tax=Microcoleus sp. bin38.metabat.b11b12b14.051 TaxID=2742709 RepID=UPI0025D91ECA|nr:O-linked N-acetylglucosamine transferase, SPINDLY family protein [Microcoleus sp. bin38.metabat.b11b12b14.051]
MDLTTFNLKPLNLLIFPDWSQAEELLYLELAAIIKSIVTHRDRHNLALLIDSTEISEDSELDAHLILSGILMNLCMEEDLEPSDEPEIILLENLSQSQWQNLVPQIQYRIRLTAENQTALAESGADKIPVLEQAQLSELILESQTARAIDFANTLYIQGRYEAAIELYQKLLASQIGDIELYFNFSQCWRNVNNIEEAIATLECGIRYHRTAGQLHFELIKICQQNGRTQQAISKAEIAADILPNEYVFKLLKHLTLPIIYEDTEEIKLYRHRFVRELENLIEQTSLTTPEDKTNACCGLRSFTNFYLAYQAHNVVESQSKYANLVHQIMVANYPQWVQSQPMPPLPENGKIRVGYVSSYLHSYSGTLWLTGWLRYADTKQLEIYCYYTGNEPDPITEQFREYSHVFRHIPHNLEAVCQQIIDDKLHILVFPEIGMDAPTIQIAALRLAPVQCSAWGHPVTSGLPTIDYFISSELMEPENAQLHYSEKLIKLPNIGVSYPKPTVGKLNNSRLDFDLREDAVIYLCCQAPFKYLPQYDFILAQIARRVPQAQFIFPRGELLRKRLKRAFAAVKLDSEDYCLFRAIATRQEYIAMNFLADVFLDTFTWSGGNTSLEAIACNLPIVTCPGEFMRGLHAYSFLKMLGVTDTIAQNEQEYIDIAVKLGLDLEWRRDVAQRMSQRHDYLFDDRVCVTALEGFYQQIVRERLES